MRRRALLGGALAAPTIARAQLRAIRVINAYGAGGTADIVCRLLFARLSERSGQSYVVENRPGAAGTIAATVVARAAADGDTLLYDATAHSVNPALFGPKLPYDTRRDFLPVFLSLVTPNTILGSNLFAPAQRGGADRRGEGGAGDDRCREHGHRLGPAPHPGAVQRNGRGADQPCGLPRLAGGADRPVTGRIQLQFSNVPGSVTHFRAGTARVLAHAGREAVAVLPGVEAIAETLPGFETYEWNGVFLPAGTPEEIRRGLNAALNATAAEPAVAEKLAALGGLLRPNTPEDFAGFLEGQFALHGRVVREANIRVD